MTSKKSPSPTQNEKSRLEPEPRALSALSPVLFTSLQKAYRRRCGLRVAVVDLAGRITSGTSICGQCAKHLECAEVRRRAVEEALRWGEPCVNLCPAGHAIWAVPLMDNNRLTGGLLSAGTRWDAEQPEELPPEKIRIACDALLELALSLNLTNGAHLELRREESRRERRRAEAIHAFKEQDYDTIREVYLREEPDLLAAIKRGDRHKAREIINRILVGIYHLGSNRLDLLKSSALELVVIMCRAAVEAGGDPAHILGVDYASLSALSRIEDEETLCHWLTEQLEHLMDAIRDNRKYPNTVLLGNALRYMEEHVGEDLTRDRVAQVACLSPSHFSHLLRDKTGRTFTDLLGQFRINRACFLLRRTGKSIAQAAWACGFQDQSYFTKVFRKYTGMTPGDFLHRENPVKP